MTEKKELELYVHIPFCIRKCAYCDFLSGPAEKPAQTAYVEALVREIREQKEKFTGHRVTTVFLGGGTPSVLEGEETAFIFRALRESFDVAEQAEITIEANPGTVTKEKLDGWKGCGINRLSIGLQSASDRELELLGRIHTYRDFLDTYEMARARGFDNINVDLISAVPGQTAESWAQTLAAVAGLGPEHISAYSLIIEEGTPFYELYGEERKGSVPPLPDEEEDRRIYKMTRKILEKYGYYRYEISNYARPGYECRHNLGYWERKEYLGLGLGASSLIGECRFHNTADMKKYMQIFGKPVLEAGAPDIADQIPGHKRTGRVLEEKERLSVQDQMEEYMFLGLRKMEGVMVSRFEQIFHRKIDSVYGAQIRKLTEEGLLEHSDGRIRLTELGIDISNYVFAEFLL